MGQTLRASTWDRALRPLHRWIWRDPGRCARKLLRFADTEADGGRDLSRAAELTRDPTLRRLYLRHADDELRHAALFRARGRALLLEVPRRNGSFEANWIAPGERGLDDLRVDGASDGALLAFLHLSEKAAAQRFAIYEQVLDGDLATREVFRDVLRDEAFHMSYTHKELARIERERTALRLWQARLARLWKAYLRLAVAVAAMLGAALLYAQYFLLLPPFALLARREKEVQGFSPARERPSLRGQS
jgi:hypothetical protein